MISPFAPTQEGTYLAQQTFTRFGVELFRLSLWQTRARRLVSSRLLT